MHHPHRFTASVGLRVCFAPNVCADFLRKLFRYLDRLINGHLAFGAGRDKTYRGIILLMVESGAILTIVNVSPTSLQDNAEIIILTIRSYLQIISLVLERLRHPGLHVVLNILVPLAVR